jgi:hypothetical protein
VRTGVHRYCRGRHESNEIAISLIDNVISHVNFASILHVCINHSYICPADVSKIDFENTL